MDATIVGTVVDAVRPLNGIGALQPLISEGQVVSATAAAAAARSARQTKKKWAIVQRYVQRYVQR